MSVFIKKVTTVYEARQYHILKEKELTEWANAHKMDNDFLVQGFTGSIVVNDGDWIVKISHGLYFEVYANESFNRTFDEVNHG